MERQFTLRMPANLAIYPHAFLSAHNYQRYIRKVRLGGKDFTVPFAVCGNGGHNVNPLVQPRGGVTPPDPAIGAQVSYLDSHPVVQAGGLVINKFDHTDYGYLRITVIESSCGSTFIQ